MTNAAPVTVFAEGVCKTFRMPKPQGEVRAVDGLSLRIRAGKLTALVGADGAGKTTFMRMLAGLLAPSAGRLQVLGIDVAKKPQTVQSRISYMPQRFGLYEDLSVQENLDLYADLHGVPQSVRRERFVQMLEMTDMARFTARPAGQLSGGMKQKLGLACTLVRSPELLLLDEPSVGVDPLSRRDLWRIVQQLVEAEGLSVIVNTTSLDEAARCAQVFFLHEGRLLVEGTPQTLAARAEGLTSPTTLPAALEDAFMRLLRQQQRATEASRVPSVNSFTLPAAESCHRTNASQAAPAIVVRDLVHRFGDFTAVASTSFSVARGEIFGLLGPNGAGKTTTFRMLCGLLPASSGQLEVAGVNLRHARRQARANIGYVSQKFALYGNLSVRENLAFFGAAYGVRGQHLRERIAAVLAQFDLAPEALSSLLPAGYKQRLAMAAALLHEPEILFLDEPTSGIDLLARREFWRTITGLAHSGVTIVITTHFMEEAEYCDRIMIQDAGKSLAIGTPQQVRERAGNNVRDMNEAFIAIVEQSRTAAADGRPA